MKKIVDILPQKDGFCVLIRNAFYIEFCDALVSEKKKSFKEASTHYPPSYRNNERQVVDDEKLSKHLFSTIREFIPVKFITKAISNKEEGEWNLKELNSRIRICRYLPNQYFHKHLDGVHYKSEFEQSKLTFMIYLNNHTEFNGGKTLFFNSKDDDEIIASYKPIKGDLIIFDHNIWHSGESVFKGEKYVLRSDIIYYKNKQSSNIKIPFGEGHLGYIWQAINFNNKLITSGRDRKIKVWSLKGDKKFEIKAHENSITSLLKLNEQIFISGSRDCSIKIWSINKRHELVNLVTVNNLESTILSMCRIDDKEFICAEACGKISVYSNTGLLVKSFVAHNNWIWSVIKISKEVIVTVSEDSSMIFWDLKNNQSLMKWDGLEVPINIAVIDDNQNIFLGLYDGTIISFSYNISELTLTKTYTKKCHDGIIRKLVFEKDKLYSVGEDNKLNVWRLKDFKLLYQYSHKNFVQDVVLFESCFFSVSYDGRIVKHEKLF